MDTELGTLLCENRSFFPSREWDPINICGMCGDNSLDQRGTLDPRWPICFSLLKFSIAVGRRWSVWVPTMCQKLEVTCTVLNKREVIAPVKACILASSYVQPCADEHSHGIIMTFTSSQGSTCGPSSSVRLRHHSIFPMIIFRGLS